MRRRNKGNFTFSNIPVVKYSRSKFDLSYEHITSSNVGDLIPFHLREVYPGDSFAEKAFIVDRTSSSYLRVPYGNLFRDSYFFFVPSRLLFDNQGWAEIIANYNAQGAWAPSVLKKVPQITGDPDATFSDKINKHHVLAYLGGVPVGSTIYGEPDVSVGKMKAISSLPAKAFAKIYDDWFRDENFIAPLNIPKDFDDIPMTVLDEPQTYHNISNEARVGSTPNAWCGVVPKVNKRPDYFTSCLPSPQKGDPITIPLLGVAPVLASDRTAFLNEGLRSGTMSFGKVDLLGDNLIHRLQSTSSSIWDTKIVDDRRLLGVSTLESPSGTMENLVPMNLYASLQNVSATDVNSLRFAFAAQKMLEKDARGGTRLTEYIANHFAVTNLDSRMDRAEFLGGSSNPLSTHQVAQTSQGSSQSALASLGGFGLSNGSAGYSKSFTEHGYVIGVSVIRQMHVYQNGINRLWFKFERNQFYDPLFSHLGEQPVYKRELDFNAPDDAIFGYNEYGADLRWTPSRVSGQMSSYAPDTLDVWTFADKYANVPTLGSDFIQETSEYVDRTLAVPSTSMDQFITDIYVSSSAIREVPLYSTPGLIDHDTTK